MQGTVPRFYKISVIRDLLKHVVHGTYPAETLRHGFCDLRHEVPALLVNAVLFTSQCTMIINYSNDLRLV
jgi:hypothetical protein